MTPMELTLGSLIMALWLGGNIILFVPLTVIAVLSSIVVAATIQEKTGSKPLAVFVGAVLGSVWAALFILWEVVSFLYVLELAGFGTLW